MTQTKRYRKRPEFVEAVKLTKDNLAEAAMWAGGRVFEDAKASDPDDVAMGVYIPTMEGVIAVRVGDYIFKRETDGALDVSSAREFERVYEGLGHRGP